MFTINEKRHIKNLFHTIKFFFLIPLKKNWNKKKNKFSYNSINKQSNSFNQKTFLILKKQDTENLTKKTTGKKIRDCISSSHWKKSTNELKNLKSDETIAQPYKNRSNHVQEKNWINNKTISYKDS